MKIIVAHNRYIASGGEDEVFERETTMLEQGGHDVIRFLADNKDFHPGIVGAAQAVWNIPTARAMDRMVRQTGAEVVHVHNTFAAFSPSIFRAAHQAGAAVIATLHNFRLFCVNAMLVRDGEHCRRCLGRSMAFPGILGRCYRDSVTMSAVIASTAALHRAAGTWSRHVDRYVAPSDSARVLMVEGGIAADRIVTKPNFTHDHHRHSRLDGPRDGALMVGRVIAEKGALVTAQAWTGLDIPLDILGDGDQETAFAALVAQGTVRLRGRVSQDEVAQAMRQASFLIAPSTSRETFGLVVIEAFAAGLPVIVSDHGGLADLVEDGRTGLRVRPGDSRDLADKVRWARDNPQAMRRMGENARQAYLDHYTPQANLPLLEAVYQEALMCRKGPTSRR